MRNHLTTNNIMDHKKSIASIKITPSMAGKSGIHIEMPVWIRKDENNKFYANLALLGGIMTYAESEKDIDIAINEAVTCFFEAAQKFGKGFKEELIALGWQIKKKNGLRYKVKRTKTDRSPISYGLPIPPAFQEVMQTGISKTLTVLV